MTQDLKTLRELCDAATDEREKLNIQAIADFIAATDPQTVRALIDEVEKLRGFAEKFIDECESEMSRADHRKKIANMDYHDSEMNHQEGRWHCAHDLAEFAQQALKGTDHE